MKISFLFTIFALTLDNSLPILKPILFEDSPMRKRKQQDCILYDIQINECMMIIKNQEYVIDNKYWMSKTQNALIHSRRLELSRVNRKQKNLNSR